MSLKSAFTNKETTPWSGMVFMKKRLDQAGILSKLIACDLPEQGSNGGHAPIQWIMSFMGSVGCGANRFEFSNDNDGFNLGPKLKKLSIETAF